MVSGYFSGSISRSSRAAGVTQPAQILTRGNTAASRSSARRPSRASRQAAVLPPGPPPTTMTSYSPPCCATGEPMATSSTARAGGGACAGGEPDLLHGVSHVHGGEEIALELDGALHVCHREAVGRGVPDESQEGLGRL